MYFSRVHDAAEKLFGGILNFLDVWIFQEFVLKAFLTETAWDFKKLKGGFK